MQSNSAHDSQPKPGIHINRKRMGAGAEHRNRGGYQ